MKSTLEEQQAFITVVDCGSITAAAERLGITVSGVSRALNRLEQKLGTTLLRRTTRRLELTEEGKPFSPTADASWPPWKRPKRPCSTATTSLKEDFGLTPPLVLCSL